MFVFFTAAQEECVLSWYLVDMLTFKVSESHCNTCLVKNFFHWCLSLNTSLFPSLKWNGFAGYRNMGWQLSSFRVIDTLFQVFLAFRVFWQLHCSGCGFVFICELLLLSCNFQFYLVHILLKKFPNFPLYITLTYGHTKQFKYSHSMSKISPEYLISSSVLPPLFSAGTELSSFLTPHQIGSYLSPYNPNCIFLKNLFHGFIFF